MSDIAQLGLSIDSTQVNAASAALDKLTAAAAPAASAAASLQTAAAGASPAMASLSTATDANSTSFRSQREALRGVASDLAIFGGSVGQTAGILGQLYIENQRLAEGFGGLTGAIGSLLTPQNLLIGATIGLAVAGVELYSSILAQEKAFDDLSDRTQTTLTDLHALASAASFQGVDSTDFLKQMTSFGTLTQEATQNLGSLAELFRANGVAAGTLQQNMASVANLVQNASSEAAKYQIVQEAGLPATREWVDFLSQGAAGIAQAEANAVAFGGAADKELVQKARDFDQQWNTAWTNFKNFADNALVGFAAKLDDLSHNSTLMSLLKTGLNAIPGGAIIGAATGLYGLANPTTPNSLVSGGFSALGNAGSGSSTFATQLLASQGVANPNTPTTQTSAQLEKSLSDYQALIGALGPLASITDTVSAKSAALDLMYQKTGVDLSAYKAQILDYTQKQALGTLAIEQQTNAQNIQAATIGMSVGAAQAYSTEQQKLFDFQQRGITLTAAQTAALHTAATAYGQAAQQTATLKAQNDAWFQTMQLGTSNIMMPTITALHNLYGDDYQAHLNDAIASQITFNAVLSQTKNIADNALNTFADDLLQGKSAADSLRDALLNVEEQLIKIATNQVLSAAFGSGLSGLFGGLLGGGGAAAASASAAAYTSGATSLGGGLSALVALAHTGGIVGQPGLTSRYIHPAYFDDAPRFHDGGIVAGEVPIIAKAGEGVFTPQQMAAMAPAGSSGPQITINNNNNFTGADPGSEARIKAYVDQRSKQTVSDAVAAVRQANSTAPAYLRNGR